jgi:hypothetical protein
MDKPSTIEEERSSSCRNTRELYMIFLQLFRLNIIPAITMS